MTRRDNAIGLYMKGIRDGNPAAAQAAFTGARYTQHSTGVLDGSAGFIEFFDSFIKRNPKREIRVVRALEDGNHVFVHVYQSLNEGDSKWVTTDFFDTDAAGKIIEHWDVIGPYVPANPSGRSNIDGPTEITDLHKTDANKTLVGDFIKTCLIDRQTDRMAEFINPSQYDQHNVEGGDGFEHFRDFYAARDCPLSYQECFLMVGEGNFVATLNRAK